MRYPALIDGEAGAYGVVFPDLPGICAMGTTVDEALVHAEDSLRDYAIEAAQDGEELIAPSALEDVDVPPGSTLTSILLIRESPCKHKVRVNMVFDADILAVITSEARRHGITRKDYIEWLVRRMANGNVHLRQV